MVSDPNIAQPQPYFPSPTQAVSYGFRFLSRNIWIIVVFAGLSSLASAVAIRVLDGVTSGDGTGTIVVAIVIGAVLALLSALFRLVLIRRTLDYWGETQAGAKPRSFAEAVNTAVDGAQPRTLPYIGWSMLWAVVFVAAVALGFVVADLFDGVVAILVLLLVLVAALIFVWLSNFFLVAAVDRPGNPMARSFHVFKNHFLRITATYLIYAGIVFAVSAPIAIIGALISDSGSADSVVNAIAGVVGVILGGALVGSDALMYRAVYPPENG